MEKSKQYAPCDFVWKARDNQPKPLTREIFETLLGDMNVQMLCEKVREHNKDSERYKISLPAVTWQSHFHDRLRTDANAVPSGLFCLDVDIHHEDMFLCLLHDKGKDEAYAWAENEARQRAQLWADMQRKEDESDSNTLGIVGIHVSPSGTGIHVIAIWDESCKSIAENQARLARLLCTSYDEVCKDWARIFFVAPREDWTYIDLDTIFSE